MKLKQLFCKHKNISYKYIEMTETMYHKFSLKCKDCGEDLGFEYEPILTPN